MSERDELITNETPADPLGEDTSVLALFDALIEDGEDTSNYFDSSSSDNSDDDDDDDESDSDDLYLMEDAQRLRRVMRALPFFGSGFRRLFSDDDDDSDATPTDSELSCANMSSLEPPWSMDEDDMEELDEELMEMYGSDVADWGSSDGSDSESALSEEEEEAGEEDGRAGRISNRHDKQVGGGRDKAKETGGKSTSSGASAKKNRMQKTDGSGPSCSQSEQVCNSDCGALKSGSQSHPTRCQPSRKAKKAAASAGTSVSANGENTSSTTAAEKKRKGGNSAAGSGSQPKLNNNKRYQPKRKVKSAPGGPWPSAATGCDDKVVVNSEPSASSSSSSSMVKPKKSGRAIANGNSSATTTDSGRGFRAVATGNSEATSSGSEPSRRWMRKRNRRQQEANGTAADSYQQYRPEDFLKAKSPTSFYAKKKDPP